MTLECPCLDPLRAATELGANGQDNKNIGSNVVATGELATITDLPPGAIPLEPVAVSDVLT